MIREQLIEKLERLKEQETQIGAQVAEHNNAMIEAEADQYLIQGEIARTEAEIDLAEIAEAERREQADAMEDHLVGDLEDQLERIL